MWPKNRREQLTKLIDLVNVVSDLNSGSRFLDKTEDCISLARALRKSDINKPEVSFLSFLATEACKNESAPAIDGDESN